MEGSSDMHLADGDKRFFFFSDIDPRSLQKDYGFYGLHHGIPQAPHRSVR